jgi:transcriptional regulator GlxA family with amidase domain
MRVEILLFDDFEVLDACGPFEVFATARRADGTALCDVAMVAESAAPVRSVGGMMVLPTRTINAAAPPDILVIPGGQGRRTAHDRPATQAWIAAGAARGALILSVCTGAFFLATAGLLRGRRATTHHSCLDELESLDTAITVERDVRFVDEGRIVTAAGIAAGIDASLHVVARELGRDVAERTARRMEYGWTG